MDWNINKNKLTKEYTFKDFSMCISFANKIKDIANKKDHHPDLYIHSYNKIRVELMTHSENKITQKDYDMAELIDNITL
jgi:4a-hydroxytetrahydrobiopterin dehydratase